MNQLKVCYFAGLREVTGVAEEIVQTQATDLRGLYAQLQAHYGWSWPVTQLRVAVDGDFAAWEDAVRAGSEVAFIPPVSGG